MTLRQYIILMLFGTLIAFGGIGLITVTASPSEAGTIVFAVFYALIFFGLLGLTSLLGLLFRARKNSALSTPHKVEVSFRQGILLSALVTTSLILQSQSLLNWWNALLLVGAVSSVETVFLKVQSK